ncbi:class I SAM-dependent methyltransferase [Nocardioides humilatus]|uniref:Class I SAM-dependent methyltransferase n=1 Tax=Nocardioides humilatus TaxID=2607660 RepID=A0A5B1LMM9_9ACTN|nr:class I SAM-dependent methyltransferase [Nocardioides humilatus]KAA1421070.1 class I SAM-dependent methyltransferase [Nocardioides humilatus]
MSDQNPDAEPTGQTEDLGALRVRDNRLVLPADLDPESTYDVLLNDRHVWSVQPQNDTTAGRGGLVAKWPASLHRYLSGHADVVIREHVGGTVVARAHHVFQGADDQQVDVVDRSGNPLIIDKYGKLIRPLSAEGTDTLSELMDQVEDLITCMREKAGVPTFIAYGTLLGAVRNGQLIGHDNDLDIAYLSDHAYPVDVLREAYRIERVLLAEGWSVRRGSGARMNVRMRLSDDSVRFVDVFTAHWVEGVLYIPQDTGFRLERETIVPLTTVELLGRQVPAPADYETLLAATYGKGWATPDPSFKYETPRWLSRRIGGWFGGLRTHRKQWDTFYAAHRSALPTKPSPFARWVREHYPSDRPMVDIGAGNARDARWFARTTGRPVTAIDYTIGAMLRAQRRVSDSVPLSFEVLNLYDAREALGLGVRLSRLETPADVYARFLLHALEDVGRENFWRVASMALRAGGHLFLEFRTTEDRKRPHVFQQVGRRYLDPATVVAEIEAAGGRVLHQESGTGLAPFKTEDPHVCRIVATWS